MTEKTSNRSISRRVVLVVGGTSGINRGIAEGFAREGARVAVVSRCADKVESTRAELTRLGAEARGFAADVRDPEALASGVKALCAEWGPLDLVVSGAAGNFPALGAELSVNGFRSVVEIDLLGSFHVLKAVYPYLRRPSTVLHISAPQAQQAMVGQVHVCAAKAGVDMLTRTLAQEWGPEGIRVNSVIPGPVEGTEGMARLAPTSSAQAAVRQSVPLRRLGRAEDIFQACRFLASEQASFITGAVVPVDGGWSLAGASRVGDVLGDALGL